ncbi:MAG: zinc ABC transporter substrate-binding protein [Fischerella sp.]|nr:zinc ABC transporter substrate-binding protein [Fischerella sp.]
MSNTRYPNKIKLLAQSLRAILVVLTIGFVGCNYTTDLASSSSTNTTTTTKLNSNLPRVVATTSVLCDLTKQVAAQTINLTCLASPNVAPYLYQPKPEDSIVIEQAKVIFYNGYGFEPSLLRLIRTSKSRAAKIAVAQRAVPNPLKYRRNGKIVPNPYVWHNPKNGIRMVEIISSNLSKAIPENASLYNSNAQRIKKELNQLDVWIKLRIASIPTNNRKLVTTNDAMAYYVKAYDLSFPNSLKGISRETKPTSARVKALVRNLRRTRVPTIFVETKVNPELINTVAKTAKVKVSERQLLVDNLGTSGNEGDTYQKMLTANTRTILEGLGGTYLIFEPQALTNQ